MSSSRNVISRILSGAASTCVSGVICGAVGAKVLLDTGHAASVLGAVRAGAAGGTAIGGMWGVVSPFLIKEKANDIGHLLVSVALSAASGALGQVMLGQEKTGMTLNETTASLGTGAGVMIGAGLALGLGIVVLYGACTCVLKMVEGAPAINLTITTNNERDVEQGQDNPTTTQILRR